MGIGVMIDGRKDEAARRQLRLEIARCRRRIDRRARRLEKESRRLASWTTYVRRYPAYALAASFGAGLALASGWRAWLGRVLGVRVTRRAVDGVIDRVLDEVQGFWERSRSEPGGDDG